MSLRSIIVAVAAAVGVAVSSSPIASAAEYQTPVTPLASLTDNVGEYAPSQDYDRDLFPTWRAVSNVNAIGWSASEHPSCNVREAALIDAGENVTVTNPGCNIIAGEWKDPYVTDPVVVTDSSTMDLDHVVPLAHAWRTGADQMDNNTRAQIALDRDNLILTSAAENRSKGDQAIDSWFPQRNSAGYCDYAAKYATVVDRYDLTIDQMEYDQLNTMYNDCGYPGGDDTGTGGDNDNAPVPAPSLSTLSSLSSF